MNINAKGKIMETSIGEEYGTCPYCCGITKLWKINDNKIYEICENCYYENEVKEERK